MSAILIAQKVETSDGDCPSEYEQAQKLTLISSDVPKKAIIENWKFSYSLLT